jgi:hypothetical protein
MTMVANALRELAGLFVDDGALALSILGVVGLAALAVALLPQMPMAAGVLLLLGFPSVLLLNVVKAARR